MTGKKRLRSPMWKLTLPLFIELVLQMLVGNADQIMVGWQDPNGVGAIGNANQITVLILLVFSVVCTASTILVSQYLGARDTRKLSRIYTVSLITNIVFGLVTSVILVACARPIFTLMGVKPEFFSQAVLYLRIVGGGMVFQAVFLTFTAFFRANQMMVESMIANVAVNVLNLIGNTILINGLFGLSPLGVAGAAIASVLSRLLGVILIAFLFFRRLGPVVSLRVVRPFPWGELRRLLAIGIPTGGESLSYNLSQVAVQTVCNTFAPFMVNTRVYANMFAMLTYMFAAALSQATQVLVANLVGGRELDQAERRVKRTLLAGCIVSGSVSLLLALVARPLFSLFTQDPDILDLCILIMLVEIPLELGRAVNLTMVRSLQACGDIRFPVILCVISAWVFPVAGGWLLGRFLGLGLVGVWIAMSLDEDFRAVLLILRWRKGKWRDKHLIESQ